MSGGASGSSPAIDPGVLAEAKARVEVSDLVKRSVRLSRAGREFKGLCPFHDESTASFTVNDDKGFYHCFGCGAHGDQLAWLMRHDGMAFLDAARVLIGEAGLGDLPSGQVPRSAPERREGRRGERDGPEFVPSIEVARFIWRLRPVAGWRTPVETWLRTRGVHPGPDSPVLEQLRFHPRVPTGAWPVGQEPRRFGPAMIAAIEAPILEGACVIGFAPIGLHVTYLADEGRTKAGRKMFGGTAGGGVLLGDWSADAGHVGADTLAVAEGIETTLAFLAREGVTRGVAALSLNNLQGYPLEDRAGAVPLYDPRPDPGRAMLCWPGESRVLVGVDADMKGLKDRTVREHPRAVPVKRDLSGAERTELCGRLASAAWRATGARVSVKRPPMGADFGDLAREGV
ncbi:CHC2 zinc finger domain-containing protein [Croceicoccus sp. BE223]|uniref:CHC2 zinc finger domain-containing protein n=1 Tax=Croceicoccus sp. BE223 TaxID=2817716 RepID=UPI002856D3BE|nr:CHC2 zinc finger domain-containing protein [Croceicoccus sp. BE223]MDR7101506.1 DNA primase [Croceicoccus sp. BE223]